MDFYTREGNTARAGKRKLIISNCYSDCPFAEDKENQLNTKFIFHCALLNKEICFDDELPQFSTLEECPLEKYEE